MKIKPTTFSSLTVLLAAATCALVTSAISARADIIVTPDQFTYSTWNNLTTGNATGAYPGDPGGYLATADYSQSPSGLINIPLTGLAPGWNAYYIYEWQPVDTSSQWHSLNVINNGIGYGTPTVPGEPWAGQFGTQQQWVAVNGTPVGGWNLLGPGPQTDPSLGGSGVWINGSGAPSYLQFHYAGFETAPETFDAIKVVLVPEPTTLALGLFGGLAMLGLIFRRPKH